ncbi:MAG: MATE family efflux transporter [Polyangiaceae bacterium]|nr:MATE family efflux transporter [Polyangiaceae bacterium]
MNQAGDSAAELTRGSVFRIAWPIILANAAVPLLGIADTAVIGHVGTTSALGAIALGALIFSFVYWSFGFLRMGTTGFVAQADGAGEPAEVRAVLGRALLLAGLIGVGLLLLQWPIAQLAWAVFSASPEVEGEAAQYFAARIWGAPAALGTFALMGTLIGLGKSRQLLVLQLLLNGLNITLDVTFAGVLGWGVRGIGLGTAVAEWVTLLASFWTVRSLLKAQHSDAEAFWSRARILDRSRLAEMFKANADIMLRTLFLLGGFAWFTDRSAKFGDTNLAANHVLLELVSFAAFFLDGYAFAAESLVGRAIGARSRRRFDAAALRSSELALVTSCALAAACWLGGELAVRSLTNIEEVRRTAATLVPLAALYILLSFAAFQLDGIFVGATRTRQMRNASVISMCVFVGSSWPMMQHYGNRGLWFAFIGYVVIRAVSLGAYLPGLRRAIDDRSDCSAANSLLT